MLGFTALAFIAIVTLTRVSHWHVARRASRKNVAAKSPDLPSTIAFVNAGGGPGKFSTVAALTALVGADLTGKEVAKLTSQYGKESVTSFVTVFNFAVDDATKIAIADGVKFPAPGLSGKKLAAQLVGDGTVKGTFWTGYMLDHLVTHKIHDQTMDDIDAKYGAAADANYHKVSNQALFDLAQALGAKSVMLANFHKPRLLARPAWQSTRAALSSGPRFVVGG